MRCTRPNELMRHFTLGKSGLLLVRAADTGLWDRHDFCLTGLLWERKSGAGKHDMDTRSVHWAGVDDFYGTL